MELAVYAINLVARRHERVMIPWQSGNHDEATAVVLQAALAALYQNNPRIEVIRSGKRTYCFQWGEVALGFTHGDTIKAANLPLLMATDYPQIWAQTTHRIWHTGHIHHQSVAEYPGCSVESHRSPAPRDTWHERNGYRSLHNLSSIVYNKTGEYARNIVWVNDRELHHDRDRTH